MFNVVLIVKYTCDFWTWFICLVYGPDGVYETEYNGMSQYDTELSLFTAVPSQQQFEHDVNG